MGGGIITVLVEIQLTIHVIAIVVCINCVILSTVYLLVNE